MRIETTCFLPRGMLLAAGALAAVAAGVRAEPPAFDRPFDDLVYYDTIGPDGRLTGGRVVMTVDPRPLDEELAVAGAETLARGGSPANRVDLAIVGDGYTMAELPLYANHAAFAMGAMFNIEPFRTYQDYFNIHRVDVVSNVSGVSNDPDQGIMRDTPLGMAFWCNGIQRLLCVNVGAAFAYAAQAPGRDLVLAIANSTTYGGAGYASSNLATVSGGNGASPQIAIHEFGHSLGDLADEYDYGGPETYVGGERPEPNASIYTSAQQLTDSRKWFRWMGVNLPGLDAPVNTYEGCHYSRFGVYRPSPNSMMRNLGRPFNAPSAEAIVVRIYQFVRPIESSFPPGAALAGYETCSVQVMQPVGHALDVQWSLDGAPIPGATATTLSLGTLCLPPGVHTLEVKVTDNTSFVRDPVLRAQRLTQTRAWTITTIGGCYGSGQPGVGLGAISIIINAWGTPGGPSTADIDCDGQIGLSDLAIVIQNWGQACP